ncbi:WhiB family transcriptional regulator [Actinomyces faecalis]|uniref:WhiB family transcriptional regulator n=1 Tax=Actinomyces faecalis TaxID=2722820 RepID=UPI001C130DF0|nr:WhiB family transcriptional regulator [Actinomyces faecalis]
MSEDLTAAVVAPACAVSGLDPDAWFDLTDLHPQAVRVCRSCPLRRACLEQAARAEAGLGPTHRFGVWGGLTPRQRYRRDPWVRRGASDASRRQVEAMRAAGMRWEQVSEATGVSLVTLRKLRDGGRVSAATAARISQAHARTVTP